MAAWLTYAHSCVSRSRFEPRGRRRDLFFSDADSVSFFFGLSTLQILGHASSPRNLGRRGHFKRSGSNIELKKLINMLKK